MKNNITNCNNSQNNNAKSNQQLHRQHQQSQPQHGELKRGLTNRHLQLIAIGGTIGTSLFLGSAKTIQTAGPIIVLNYMIAGVVMFLAMRVLGEMLLSNLKFRSFKDIATHYLGGAGGFIVGWMYWAFWIVTGMQDSVAVGVYLKSYFPNMPKWLPGLCVVIFIFLLNSITVSLFGELEFWLSIIKVVAILVLIAVGAYMIITMNSFSFTTITGSTQSYQSGLFNLWRWGGFAPKGITGFLFGFQMAFLAYTGIELVGVTAGETKNPEKTLPKAINALPWRIAIFYAGAVIVILCVLPWNIVINLEGSPFVNIFKAVGISSAGIIMTIVLITAAVSGANGGLYSTSRMLFGLSIDNQAPKTFAKTSKKSIPQNGLNFAFLMISIPVIIVTSLMKNPMDAFIIFANWATVCNIIVWLLVLSAYFLFRKNHKNLHEKSSFKTIGGKISASIVIGLFVLIIVLMMFEEATRIGVILAAVFLIALLIVYYAKISKIEHIEQA